MTILSTPSEWPVHGGELGERIRSFDWSTTSLGPIALWPDNLRVKANSVVNSPIPHVLMWGPDHVMIYNDGYRHIAGHNHPAALGGRIADIWPEIWDWNRTILEAGFRGEIQSFRDQSLTLNRNGVPEQVYFDLFYTPIYGDEGTVDGVLCTVIENTEKVMAREALASSQAELTSITDTLPILVGYIAADRTYRFANRGYLDWFGKPPEEVVGRPIEEVLGQAFYDERLPIIERAFAGETMVTDSIINRPDGVSRAAEIRYTPRLSASGTVEGIYVLIIDIHDRKTAETELRASNARFSAAVHAVHGVLWTNTPEGRMEGEQTGWAALTGQSREQYEGYGWSSAVHPDDRLPSIDSWNAAVATKSTFIYEHRVRRHDGEWRTFLIRAVPIFNDAGEIAEWVGIHTDITEQRAAESALQDRAAALEQQVRHRERAEEQLRQLNETLEARVISEIAERRQAEVALQQSQKMETIGKLTGGIAHDFNNLLQVVSGNLQLLSKDVAGNERAERRVANALAGVSRGAKLANQLLAFGRRQPLEPKVVNIARFLSGMDDMLRRSIGEAIEIETIVAGGLWNCLVDPTQVENALLNLAINARDAMEGTGKLTIEVGNAYLDDTYARKNAEVDPGQYVMLAVSDTGSGMTPEIIEQVFEPFFSTKPEGKGTGLGLSMVYGFVKQTGGHVKIYSEVGLGTTVKLYLPRASASEDCEAVLQSGPVVGGSEMVLVVEDDDEVRATVIDLLGELGYRVLKASNAQSALSIVESGIAIDLLFTDVVMPGTLKSPELARRARERMPNLAVLFTSGYTENSIVHGGRLDAGVELLSKPYTREALARKIRLVLDNQQQRNAATSDAEFSERPPAPRPDLSPLTILLVEDDSLIRSNTAEMLQDIGHRVIEASSGGDALTKLKGSDIDVLMTDLGLPDMSGADLAQIVRRDRRSIGVVFATGNDSIPDDSVEGAVLLRKPYDSSGLLAALRQLPASS